MTVKRVSSMGRNYERLSFDSDYEPHEGEPGRERWRSYTGNNREYALMFRHRRPRPWLICIHGAEMGRAALDPMLFHAWHLYRDLGLNVALPYFPCTVREQAAQNSPVRTCSTTSTAPPRRSGTSGD